MRYPKNAILFWTTSGHLVEFVGFSTISDCLRVVHPKDAGRPGDYFFVTGRGYLTPLTRLAAKVLQMPCVSKAGSLHDVDAGEEAVHFFA